MQFTKRHANQRPLTVVTPGARGVIEDDRPVASCTVCSMLLPLENPPSIFCWGHTLLRPGDEPRFGQRDGRLLYPRPPHGYAPHLALLSLLPPRVHTVAIMYASRRGRCWLTSWQKQRFLVVRNRVL